LATSEGDHDEEEPVYDGLGRVKAIQGGRCMPAPAPRCRTTTGAAARRW
jgi:hypothetical protein